MEKFPSPSSDLQKLLSGKPLWHNYPFGYHHW